MNRFDILKKKCLKNWYVVLIILCALFLRLYRLGDFAMFLADQGRDALIVKQIATLNHFPLIGPPSSLGQVYLGPFYYYLIAPFLFISFFHPVGLAFGVSILSIIGLIGGYWVIRRLINPTTALFFLLFVTYSYHLFDIARFSWNPNLLPYFAFFTLYFLYMTLKTKKRLHAVCYGVFFALSFQLHHLAAFLAFPSLIMFLFSIFIDDKRLKVLESIVISFCAFLVISSPLFVFELKHDYLNTKNLISLFTEQNMVAGGSPLKRLIDTNQSFFQHTFQTSIPSYITNGISLVVLCLMVCMSFIRKKTKNSLFVWIHFVHFYSFIYLFSMLSGPRHPHYYGLSYLSFFLILAYLIDSYFKEKYFKWALFILIFSLYFFFNTRRMLYIFGPPGNQMNHAQIVAESIIPYMSERSFNFATYPPDFTSEDSYVYFLELHGFIPAQRKNNEVTSQMFVFCNKKPCNILHSGSWNITMFGKAKIDRMWKVDGISVYKLVH